MWPQSGHSQVTLLHDMPHSFSCIHFWQIWNEHAAHAQQNGGLSSHIVHRYARWR